jgi:Uma2 family endonuclease
LYPFDYSECSAQGLGRRRQAVTAVHDRPVQKAGSRITVEEFEELASGAPEDVSLEFLFGKVGEKAVPDGDHGTIIVWFVRQFVLNKPELDVYTEQGMQVEAYRKGRARPDAVVVPRWHLAGQPEWADSEGVLMAVEITSFDDDTDQRDRVDKPRAYAETGIPVYLLVDREAKEFVVYSEPSGGRYATRRAVPIGERLALPAPVDILLDSDELKDRIR